MTAGYTMLLPRGPMNQPSFAFMPARYSRSTDRAPRQYNIQGQSEDGELGIDNIAKN